MHDYKLYAITITPNFIVKIKTTIPIIFLIISNFKNKSLLSYPVLLSSPTTLHKAFLPVEALLMSR